jgi:Lanthionine synthetase C-like protein
MTAPLHSPDAHEELAGAEWSEARARTAIRAIVAACDDELGPGGDWPGHPLDDLESGDAVRGVYLGAAGTLLALAVLRDAGLAEPGADLAGLAAGALGRYEAAPDFDGEQWAADPRRSLWIGETGILLVAHRLAPERRHADRLAELTAANADDERRELMWGAAGTMLAALEMHARTGDSRFDEIWRSGAERLLATWAEDAGLGYPVWTQRLYGSERRFLGPAHGLGGNVLALLRGEDRLEPAQAAAVHAGAARAMRRSAVVAGGEANWPALAGDGLEGRQGIRTQWCHGAPGMVAALAAAAPGDDEHTALLVAGGALTWRAGPLRKGPGLCHGTVGNGLAFLHLFHRTGDERWLARARAFGMHAAAQVESARAEHGRGRHTLWAGDPGVAVYLALCLAPSPRLPGLDAW